MVTESTEWTVVDSGRQQVDSREVDSGLGSLRDTIPAIAFGSVSAVACGVQLEHRVERSSESSEASRQLAGSILGAGCAVHGSRMRAWWLCSSR